MENKPMVVDVRIRAGHPVIGSPSQQGEGLQQQEQSLATIAQCAHVRSDGLRCGRRAAPGREQCEWHGDWNFQLMSGSALPYPEDAISIQQLLAQSLAMVLLKRITPEQGRAAASLCKEMRANLARFEWEMRRYQLATGELPGEAKAPYLP